MAKTRTLKATNLAKSKRPVAQKKEDASGFDDAVIVKKLADNERKVREQALKALTQLLSTRKTIDEFKLQKLWKGLFFSVWHSDRPLTQQALVQDLAALTQVLKDNNYWPFVNAFWLIMSREWHSIDKYRVDKFYMLVRFYFNAMLTRLSQQKWDAKDLQQFASCLSSYALDPSNAKIPHALRLHMCDIILDEIDKVRQQQDDEDIPIKQLIQPVVDFVEHTHFKTIKLYAISDVLKDPRLEKWGYVSKWTPQEVAEESDSSDFDEGDDDDEEEAEEEEEFTGFD